MTKRRRNPKSPKYLRDTIGREAASVGIIAVSPEHGVREYYDQRGKMLARYLRSENKLWFPAQCLTVPVGSENAALELVVKNFSGRATRSDNQ